MEKKLSREFAEQEFDRFAESMDLDVDPAFMDEDDVKQFEKQKNRILQALMAGSLVINDSGEAIYTPVKSDYHEPIRFHERTGASVMAADSLKKGRDFAKVYAMMGDMTRVHPGVFAKLRGVDIKVCEAIFAVLMD